MISLQDISRRCKYTNEDETLLDILIANVQDQEITRELVQLPATKTLQDAVTLAQSILTGRCNAETITSQNKVPPITSSIKPWKQSKQPFIMEPGACKSCGHLKHLEGQGCPAIGKKCIICGGMDHYPRCCTSKKDKKTKAGCVTIR